MTRSTLKILIGLSLGIAVGLFLGERAGIFAFAANAWVRLLQMTVLPYVMVSVIAGIGAMNVAQARRLFLRVGALTLILWALALGVVFLMPLTFPRVETASFFSTSLVEQRESVDFVTLYIPTNAFHSLANNVVPAVVLFSVVLGVAFIFTEKKEPLLSSLMVLEKVLARANRFAVSLTPYGLFAIAANTAGTMDFGQMGSLRVFLIGYIAISLLLALWILPGLVACLTPIPARRVLRSTRDALITAFMTGDLFVVLPTLIERAKALLEEYGLHESEEGSSADVIIPAFYNFPHVAKLLSLTFVLFAAWYSDTVLTLPARAQLSLAGIVSLFGSLNTAIPFLLDLTRVPADTFQLFLATSIVNARFGTLVAAMHMVVLALAGSYALSGRMRFSPERLLRYGLITAAATALTLAGVTIILRVTGVGTYDKNQVALEMQFRFPPEQKAKMLTEQPQEPLPPPRQGGSLFDSIRERGFLRVGYIDGTMPYSFVNKKGQLVGFDVEMAYRLATELGVSLEFAPVLRDHLEEAINAGRCDVVMAGVILTTRRAAEIAFSAPYLDEVAAFVVPDHRRADFSDAEWIRRTSGLRIAVPNFVYFQDLLRRDFPNVTAVPIPYNEDSVTDFFEGRGERVDGMLFTAERGSFRTLLHPAFSVAVPHPVIRKIPVAYPVARNDIGATRFLTNWIELKKDDGTIQTLYDHWILGRNARPHKPRWSILRNVLHVGEPKAEGTDSNLTLP